MEENREVVAEATQEELNELLQIRRDKLTALREAGMDPFEQVRFDRTSNSQEILNNFEQMENQEVSIAGRIMSKRDMGKASFSHIQDQQGRIQIYVKIDEVGDDGIDDDFFGDEDLKGAEDIQEEANQLADDDME